jgi:hypothetical protein
MKMYGQNAQILVMTSHLSEWLMLTAGHELETPLLYTASPLAATAHTSTKLSMPFLLFICQQKSHGDSALIYIFRTTEFTIIL